MFKFKKIVMSKHYGTFRRLDDMFSIVTGWWLLSAEVEKFLL